VESINPRVWTRFNWPRSSNERPYKSTRLLVQIHDVSESSCFAQDLIDQSWPVWTSSHQSTIQWVPVITQLWMNLTWLNLWFTLGNPICRK
jgi:hypothetical protein